MKAIKLALFAFLQLFAYDPQAQPANNTGSQTLSVENQTYYDKQLIRYAEPNLVHLQFGQERDIPQRAGQKINFRSFSSLGKMTEPLVEGVTPDPQNLEATAIEATVRQYGGFVALTDILDMTAIDPVITETVRLIGNQAGQSLDSIARDRIHADITNVAYASKYSGGTEIECFYRYRLDSTAKLTVKEMEKQYTELESQNAPKIDGYYICITHPKALYDLKRDPDWRSAQQYTSEVKKIYKNEVGEIAGFRFITSTEAKIFKGENLAGNTRELTLSGAISASTTTLSVSETLTANALKDRYVIIGSGSNAVHRKVVSNTTNSITIDTAISSAAANTKIFPGEGGADGIAVFSCLCFGADAYGKTKVAGGGLTTIIKPLGSGGTSDPLNQRSTIGWKALLTAKVLIPEYIRRLEVGGTYATATQKVN